MREIVKEYVENQVIERKRKVLVTHDDTFSVKFFYNEEEVTHMHSFIGLKYAVDSAEKAMKRYGINKNSKASIRIFQRRAEIYDEVIEMDGSVVETKFFKSKELFNKKVWSSQDFIKEVSDE